MAALAEVFAKQLSPALIDLYWAALQPLAIEQFQQGAASWIRHGKHFPKPAEILERFRELTQTQSKPFVPLPPPDRKWLGFVNALFLRYLQQRRLTENFRGDINIKGRRDECLSLVAHMEAMEAEFPADATEAHLKTLFVKAMARIPDRSEDETWLPIELERQRQEDEIRDRKRA